MKLQTVTILATSLIALIPIAVSAGELGLNLYGLSRHFDRETYDGTRFNELNLGLGLNFSLLNRKKFDLSLEAGLYNDSLRNEAKYSGMNIKYKILGDLIKVGFLTAAFKSDSVNDDWIFALIPALTSRYKRLSVNFVYIPKFKNINAYDSIGFYLTFHLVKL